jgi:REP element-mobilizing transposase RayT
MNRKIQKTPKRRRNSLRLPHLDYAVPYVYSLTICTYERREWFRNEKTAEETLSALQKCARQFHYSLLVYCLMPDHLHLLISPNDSGVTVSEFVRHFKSRTSFHFKKETKGPLWQRGFYDHVVRKSEDLQTMADYILHNPVRKGLAGTPEAYPYSGPKLYG